MEAMEPDVHLYAYLLCFAGSAVLGCLIGYLGYKKTSIYAQKKREEEEKNIKESSPGSLERLIKNR